ncbi:hypothetical protein [Bacteroides sp. 51]|uniref:hypothetical protein n=1 Tax=Bacteroides sp. 51 TaxID=2302938 RepID=UPI0013D4723C|nr:hypothetical protein [Bacteroides sp. 51]NDV82284.1 hypothetical protein [Bacteroides sp. 51]
MRNLKQIRIWLKRFRYRCGYGVHSPFAFDFITNVIYEKAAYYAYGEIENSAHVSQAGSVKRESSHSKKVNRLLFRLVNRVQPGTIIDAGKQGITSYYLQAGKRSAGYIPLASENIADLSSMQQVDFLYIDHPENIALVENLYEYGVGKTTSRSMMVIRGIYHSADMKTFWKRVVVDERVGITFDLYDLGILFFDHSKIKQHYIINF